MSINAMKLALEALDCLIYDKPYAGRFADALIGLRTAIQQAEAQQPATPEPVAWSEREQLRHAQAAVVMPMIGPLLDAWENADREVMSQEPELSKQLKNINSAMEDADTHPAPSVPADVVRDAERYRFILAAADDMTTSRYKSLCELLGVAITEDFDLGAAIDAAMLAAK